MGFFKPNVSTGGSSGSVESVDISHLQPKEDSTLNNKETATPERKSTPVVVEDKPVRKASSKYNVVSK